MNAPLLDRDHEPPMLLLLSVLPFLLAVLLLLRPRLPVSTPVTPSVPVVSAATTTTTAAAACLGAEPQRTA